VQAVALLESSYHQPLSKVFSSFDELPVASASVANSALAVVQLVDSALATGSSSKLLNTLLSGW